MRCSFRPGDHTGDLSITLGVLVITLRVAFFRGHRHDLAARLKHGAQRHWETDPDCPAAG